MQIRVLTRSGPRDIEVADWDRVEAEFASVSVMDLCVPEEPLCPALVRPDFEPGYARLRRGLHRIMEAYEMSLDEGSWLKRHAHWLHNYRMERRDGK